MKKIFFAIAAIVTGFMSSCSNEEIQVTPVGKVYDVTYDVSPQGMYDEFGMTDDIRDFIRDREYAIGVTSFLYNADGELVDSVTTGIYQFNTVTQEFKDVLDGNYTIVSIETIVDPDRKFKAPYWTYVETKKLSTLQIRQDAYEIYARCALGVSTSTLVVNGGNVTVSATPKAIGSMVELYFKNFDKSTHVAVAFGTDDMIGSYKLDPSLSRTERFVTDQTSSGYTNIRYEGEIDGQNLFSGMRYILESSIDYTFYFKKKENENTTTWTYYYANEGTMDLKDATWYYGGFYYVDANSEPKHSLYDNFDDFYDWYMEVTEGSTTPDADLIPELYMEWGGSVASTQAFMSDYTMILGASGKAERQEDGTYMIAYNGENAESLISYSYASATTGLFETDVMYDPNEVTMDELNKELNSKYTFLLEESNIYMYATSDFATYVLLYNYGSQIAVGFVDVNYIANSARIPATSLLRKAPAKGNGVQIGNMLSRPSKKDVSLSKQLETEKVNMMY